MYGVTKSSYFQSTVVLDLSCNSIRKNHSQALLLFVCTQSSVLENILYSKCQLKKKICGICFNISNVGGSVTWQYKPEHGQNLKERPRKCYIRRGIFEKLYHFLGYLESHTHVQSFMYAQEILEWVPISHLGYTCSALPARKIMQSCKMPKN